MITALPAPRIPGIGDRVTWADGAGIVQRYIRCDLRGATQLVIQIIEGDGCGNLRVKSHVEVTSK